MKSIGIGGIVAAAFVANSITAFAEDIVSKRVNVKVSFERVKPSIRKKVRK